MKRVEWTVDGETVRGRLHAPAGAHPERVPVVLLAHGLSSSSVEFYDFPEKIARAGYACLTLDYRGHGQSDGERGVLSKERVRDDLLGGLQALTGEYHVDTSRVALLGHSTGAALAICAAPQIPNLRCLIALAPVARLRDEMNPLEFIAYFLLHLLNYPVRLFYRKGLRVPYKVDYKRLYVSPEAIARAEKDAFLQRTIPVKNYKPLVKRLNGVECARRLRVPALVMIGQHDIVVGKHNSRRVYNALAGAKTLLEVPGSGHSMCGDTRSDYVAARALEFLQQHLKGAPLQ